MSETGPKRTRIACVQCREQKRKCDGGHPCDTCTRYGHHCRYSAKVPPAPESPSKRRPSSAQSAELDDGTYQRSLVANSGPNFMRQLVKNIDPVNAPKLQPTAWNIGMRVPSAMSPVNMAFSIVDLLSQHQMIVLAGVYFEKVDPCYAFIERDKIFQDIEARWLMSQTAGPVDAVLCGIAALGSFFSKANAVVVEPQLVTLAKSILDEANPLQVPEPNVLTAWVCRVIYLRIASEPLPAWLASCTAMHLLEVAGLHLTDRSEQPILDRQTSGFPTQIQRRLFGVAQHLNTWISYDLGMSRVALRSPPIIPTSIAGDHHYTEKLLELMPFALSLDPTERQDDESLRSILVSLASKRDPQPPLIMAQCNLMLCVMRRLSSLNALRKSEDHVLDLSLRFLTKALGAARQMVQDDTPWHQLANNPFQIFCMLLAIDTPATLRMVDDAVQTIIAIATAYNTPKLRDAYNTVCLILYLHRKRRLEDARIIEKIMGDSMGTGLGKINLEDQSMEWTPPSDAEMTWMNNLMSEFPSLQNFDPPDLLNTDFGTINLSLQG